MKRMAALGALATCTSTARPGKGIALGALGLALAALAATHALAQTPPTLYLNATPSWSLPGEPVTIIAESYSLPGQGFVEFVVDGVVVPGCERVPWGSYFVSYSIWGTGALCVTDQLATGGRTLVATFLDVALRPVASDSRRYAVRSRGLNGQKREIYDDFLGHADVVVRRLGSARAGWDLCAAFPHEGPPLLPHLGPPFRCLGAEAIGLPLPLDYEVTHTADFSGHGVHAVVVRERATGASYLTRLPLAEEYCVDPGGSSCGLLWTFPFGRPVLSNPDWRVTHADDFDGDGRADLLWRNDVTGATALWLIRNLDFHDGAILLEDGAWQVIRTGDFDGDLHADLLWHNASTGEWAIWLMQGARYGRGAIVLSVPGWEALLTGDFDADGKTDIVWRNAATGETAIWLMDGLARRAGTIVVSNRDWTPTHVADLDGDGRKDLLWRHGPSGRVHAWLMDGLTMRSGGNVTYDPTSIVATIGDFDGDERSDILWRHPVTGVMVVQLMDGIASRGQIPWINSDPTALEVLP